MEVFNTIILIARYILIGVALSILLATISVETIDHIRAKFKGKKDGLKEDDSFKCIETFDPRYELLAENEMEMEKASKHVHTSNNKKKTLYAKTKNNKESECEKEDNMTI